MTSIRTIWCVESYFGGSASPEKSRKFLEMMERDASVTALARSVFREDVAWCSRREAQIFDLFGRASWLEGSRFGMGAAIWTYEQPFIVNERMGGIEFVEKIKELIKNNKPLSLNYLLLHNLDYYSCPVFQRVMVNLLLENGAEKLEILEAALRAMPPSLGSYLVHLLVCREGVVKKVVAFGKEYLIHRFLAHPGSAQHNLFSLRTISDLVNKGKFEAFRILVKSYPYQVHSSLYRLQKGDEVYLRDLFLRLIDYQDRDLLKRFYSWTHPKLVECLYKFNKMEYSPLARAAKTGSIEVIDLVLDHAPPMLRERQFAPLEGTTPVFEALMYKHLPAAIRVLERAPIGAWEDLVTIRNPFSHMLYFWNELEGDKWEFVRLLFTRTKDRSYRAVMGDGSSHTLAIVLNNWPEVALELVRFLPEVALPLLLEENGRGISWREFISEYVVDVSVDLRDTLLQEIQDFIQIEQ